MSNLLQRGASFIGDKLKSPAVAGRTVAYRRGQSEIAKVSAWPSQHEYEVVDEQGFATSVVSFDWTFTTSDLVLRGEAIEPRPRDVIAEVLNGETVTYEVMAIANRPCFEWADTSGILTLVHSRRVS